MSKIIHTQEILDRFKRVHNDRYDYSRVVYRGGKLPVKIVCSVHGEFEQTPDNHTKGQNCPDCAGKSMYTTERLLRELVAIHGDRYDFSKVEYKTMQSYVTVICPIHKAFETFPERLLLGRGCFACGAIARGKARKKDTAWFVDQARLLHGDRYDYSGTKFEGYHDVISYKCKIHGDVSQRASKHLVGQGCSICSNNSSAAELRIYDYLRSRVDGVVHRSKPFGVEFDIYVPEKKLAIEYCGLYWHSTHSITEPVSPLDKVHAMMYKHYSKWVLAKSHGVRLITIFEDEWLQSPDKVKAAIDVALGIRSKRIYARNCDTVRLESGESQQFFADNHLQGAPVGGVTLGLLHEGAVVAAMCFTKAASSRGKTNLNQWELSRYATSCGVVGGASKLLSAFLKQEVVNEIISYSDNRWFDGKMYEILGFERQKPIPADYTIVLPNRSDRVRKDQFQLSKLQKWCDKFGVPHSTVEGKSELEATFSLGCGRIYDCGKQKWLFTPKQPSGV